MKKNRSLQGGCSSWGEKKWRGKEISIFLSCVALNGSHRRMNLSLVCVSSLILTIKMAHSCTTSLDFSTQELLYLGSYLISSWLVSFDSFPQFCSCLPTCWSCPVSSSLPGSLSKFKEWIFYFFLVALHS